MGRRLHTLVAVAVAAVAASGAAGCVPGQGAGEDMVRTRASFDGTIRFGAPVSLTGKYAVEGWDTRQGYDTWLYWVNNDYGGIRIGDRRYRAEIVYYDDESEPGLAAALTERLVTRDRVDFLLGPYSSALNASSSAIADRHRTILVTGTASADSLFARGFRHFFSVMTVASRYTESALQLLHAQGARSVVVAHEDTEFPIDAGRGAVRHARELGMDVLAVETYPRAVTDVSGIVAKFRSLDPDVFVAAGYFVDALLFARAAREQGFAPDAMVLTVGPSNPAFADELGPAAELVIGPTQWEASMPWRGRWIGGSTDYAVRYSRDHGRAPTYQAAGSTAAALVLQVAIEQAGTIETEAVREALMALDIETFYGPVNFDRTGRNAAKLMGAIQIQQGGLELITPVGVATGALVYPRGQR
jgi:branched-chain amino acid transport system substrate-binding protein